MNDRFGEILLNKRIAIIGAGANGASIGADLTRAGLDVTLVEQWPAHVEAMKTNGLRIVMPQETIHVPVKAIHLCELATYREQFDIVLLLVKAYDTAWAVQLMLPYLKANGLIVGVQNGMTMDVIARIAGPERTLGCVIEVASMLFTPGVVERHSPPPRSWFAVGSMSEATRGREDELTDVLLHSGRVDVVENIRAAKWMKLVSNATTLVTTAILGLPMIEASNIPEMRELMIRSGQEALDATIGLGNPVLPIFGLTPDEIAQAQVVSLLLDRLLEGFTMPNTITTVLQDWMKDRHSEVDDINGLVVSTLATLGHASPVNSAIVTLAHAIEKGASRTGIHNLDILRALCDSNQDES